MKIPLSWLKDYIDLDLSLLEIARLLTNAGMEVEEVTVIGLPNPYEQDPGLRREYKVSGLSWEADKIVVAQIDEVQPHPNADRLVLCRLNDGQQEHLVLTGAPNLFPYKGQGRLPKPLKVAYAREGARIYDGHQPGLVLTTLKRAKIRGVESYSMVCSEKELGISDEHEGILFLDEDAPTGMPLADLLGDAVFEISILPNMIRNACVLGVARELSALTGTSLRKPQPRPAYLGSSLQGAVSLQIEDPALNPRFLLGLVRGVTIGPSPAWVQRRLRLAGMRPINNVVDATNYVLLGLGQPLHAFDYDVLVRRAGGKPPVIRTRAAHPGEKLTTLDGEEHSLESYTILVCDEAGPLSLAGVMGGLESEVTPETRTVLLEAAAWNYVNVRRTTSALHISSEAGYRFGRGIHPALAKLALEWGLEEIVAWSGGEIAADPLDHYPNPPHDPLVQLSEGDVRRLLGLEMSAAEIAPLLERLEFTCTIEGDRVLAQTPPHRLDIGEGLVGVADLIEEIARLVGYDRIPFRRLSDTLPEMRPLPHLELETTLRQVLVRQGLQELVSYRLTSIEREARLLGELPPSAYVQLKNPLTPERSVLRRSLLGSVLEALEKNIRLQVRCALFEIGPVFWPVEGQQLPQEPSMLALAITGLRQPPTWNASVERMDFYDLKGVLEGLFEALHLTVRFDAGVAERPGYHPGQCAELWADEVCLGVMGALHPETQARFDLPGGTVFVAELNLAALLTKTGARRQTRALPLYPPVLEDLAVVVAEDLPAERLEAVIRQAGGNLLAEVRLFDVFRSEQLGAGKKSLAYSLTYQSPDDTLTDNEAAKIRQRIIRRLEQELGATLRS